MSNSWGNLFCFVGSTECSNSNLQLVARYRLHHLCACWQTNIGFSPDSLERFTNCIPSNWNVVTCIPTGFIIHVYTRVSQVTTNKAPPRGTNRLSAQTKLCTEGVGVYAYFRDHDVTVPAAIKVPDHAPWSNTSVSSIVISTCRKNAMLLGLASTQLCSRCLKFERFS